MTPFLRSNAFIVFNSAESTAVELFAAPVAGRRSSGHWTSPRCGNTTSRLTMQNTVACGVRNVPEDPASSGTRPGIYGAVKPRTRLRPKACGSDC